jgi:hypothetical protein
MLKITVFRAVAPCGLEQSTQNICELKLRYSRREREVGKWNGKKGVKETVWVYSIRENIFLPLISTESVALWYTYFHITLSFVNQMNCKTLAMRTHALSRTRYFYGINIIISYPVVYREGLGSLCYVLLFRGLSWPSTCELVSVNEVRNYFAYAVDTDRLFRGAYSINRQGDMQIGNYKMFLMNV